MKKMLNQWKFHPHHVIIMLLFEILNKRETKRIGKSHFHVNGDIRG